MNSFLGSPGHRGTILDPVHRRVNMGLAWDSYNVQVVQQFEGDYVDFEQLPTIVDGMLSFKGTLHGGASLDPGDADRTLAVQVYHDPPPQSLTRGQLARAVSYDGGTHIASVRPPVHRYESDTFTEEACDHPDPVDFPANSPAPADPEEARAMHRAARSVPVHCVDVTLPWLDASLWTLSTDSFDVQVSLESILEKHGTGVYTVALWANVDGESEVVSEYSTFHETEPPDGD